MSEGFYDEEEFDEEDYAGEEGEENVVWEPPQPDEHGNIPVVKSPPIAEPNPQYTNSLEQAAIAYSQGVPLEEQASDFGLQDMFIHMFSLIGDDPTREGLLETPNRIIRSWKEIYSGYKVDIPGLFKMFEQKDYRGMVVLKDIHFCSMCEHHMLPFFGKCHVAYIPNGQVVGLSKLARLVEAYAKRLQTQENMTRQIVTAMQNHMSCMGAACVVEAVHFCMVARGVQKPSTNTVTEMFTGNFYDWELQQAFFKHIGR